tara:strand:- start:579 stop:761 length:183 start_codon:yes stop_codon:yes gene_type:complete
MARKQTNMTLPQETLDRLDDIARMLGCSRTKALEMLLRFVTFHPPRAEVSTAALLAAVNA